MPHLEVTLRRDIHSLRSPRQISFLSPVLNDKLMPMSARVALFFLGGTISMSSADGHGVSPTLGAKELLAAIPGLNQVDAEITGKTIAREQSGSLHLSHILTVLSEARESDADGFVLVQGTDTLEESAYLLDLLWDDARPFVATGAMRNPTMAGADGSANLLAAIEVASSPTFRDLGAFVVFADEIHSARRVVKSDTTSLTTFISPNTGPIGRVLEGRAHLLSQPTGRHTFPLPTKDVDVPIVYVGLGMSERVLAALADGADALVIAGFGAGHVPGWWADAVSDIATKIPVFMTSRTASGPALLTTYGAIGAEVDLQQRGVVMAGYLTPLQARLAALVMLGAGASRADVESGISALGQFN